jgi:hypothetical protein
VVDGTRDVALDVGRSRQTKRREPGADHRVRLPDFVGTTRLWIRASEAEERWCPCALKRPPRHSTSHRPSEFARPTPSEGRHDREGARHRQQRGAVVEEMFRSAAAIVVAEPKRQNCGHRRLTNGGFGTNEPSRRAVLARCSARLRQRRHRGQSRHQHDKTDHTRCHLRARIQEGSSAAVGERARRGDRRRRCSPASSTRRVVGPLRGCAGVDAAGGRSRPPSPLRQPLRSAAVSGERTVGGDW